MDETWVAYLCMVLLVLVLILMKQKPDDEIKEAKDKGSSSVPTTYYSGSSGRPHEYSEEEIAASMERLTGVLFSADARRRDPHHEHHGPSSGKETHDAGCRAYPLGNMNEYRLALTARTSHPGSHEKLVDEIEQAVQEAVDTDVYVRRRQPQVAPRSRHEAEWTEM